MDLYDGFNFSYQKDFTTYRARLAKVPALWQVFASFGYDTYAIADALYLFVAGFLSNTEVSARIKRSDALLREFGTLYPHDNTDDIQRYFEFIDSYEHQMPRPLPSDRFRDLPVSEEDSDLYLALFGKSKQR